MSTTQLTEDGYQLFLPDPDSRWGFTPERFDGWLAEGDDGSVYVSFIVSRQPGQGHLSQLFQSIHDDGFAVKVPTPMGAMIAILEHKGFQSTIEHDPNMGDVEVWVWLP